MCDELVLLKLRRSGRSGIEGLLTDGVVKQRPNVLICIFLLLA